MQEIGPKVIWVATSYTASEGQNGIQDHKKDIFTVSEGELAFEQMDPRHTLDLRISM